MWEYPMALSMRPAIAATLAAKRREVKRPLPGQALSPAGRYWRSQTAINRSHPTPPIAAFSLMLLIGC